MSDRILLEIVGLGHKAKRYSQLTVGHNASVLVDMNNKLFSKVNIKYKDNDVLKKYEWIKEKYNKAIHKFNKENNKNIEEI